ncbi:MAG: translation initiation factor IF-3 [Pseudomonadota bacterium]
MKRPYRSGPVSQDGPRINRAIQAVQVRLIGSDGANEGIVDLDDALEMAANAGLDLIEISPGANPPVCKVFDFGKYKYAMQKRKSTARKKQKTIEVKELKLRPNIDQHDYDVKMRAARKFLEVGDKVKITLRYRGREMAHTEIGLALLERVREDLGDLAKVEHEPSREGRQVLMVLAPSKSS